MQIKLMLASCFLLLSLTSLAASNIDSIGIENSNNKKIILHKVEAKESYYSIARKYSVNPKSVLNLNNDKPLQIGTIIKVPTNLPFVQEKASDANVNSSKGVEQLAIIEYKVGVKETLFAISKKFNTSVEDIKTLNKLTRNSLSVGQIIKVHLGNGGNDYTPPATVAIPVLKNEPKNTDSEVDSSTTAGERLKLPPARYGLREIDERGVAVSIADQNLDGSKMLALHRTAPIGTVVKITNPMTNKSTFAKVVGKFTENETTKDVIIVITKATAKLLGALDNRFQVSIVYGVPILPPTIPVVTNEE